MLRLFFVSILCLLNCSCAYQINQLSVPAHQEILLENIVAPSSLLQNNEQLVYAVNWSGVPSGQIILKINGIEKINNQDCYHLSAQAIPNSFFAFFYNVKYTVKSYFDLNHRAQSFVKTRELNSLLTQETILFDYARGKLRWSYSRPKEIKELELKENVYDLLSFLYYLRLQNLTPGQSYKINIIYNGAYFPVNVDVSKIYAIQIGAKKINAVLVTPISELNKNITGFNQIQVYFSLDKCRVPILFRMRTKIGYLNGVLLPEASKCQDLN